MLLTGTQLDCLYFAFSLFFAIGSCYVAQAGFKFFSCLNLLGSYQLDFNTTLEKTNKKPTQHLPCYTPLFTGLLLSLNCMPLSHVFKFWRGHFTEASEARELSDSDGQQSCRPGEFHVCGKMIPQAFSSSNAG